mmetsp:Transcript_28608/g.52198  ORF Transcript_28608/g.52198 Transcript_28608/m.52198 type:complete len:139 (-) Transcript_28608:629-1045(-)
MASSHGILDGTSSGLGDCSRGEVCLLETKDCVREIMCNSCRSAEKRLEPNKRTSFSNSPSQHKRGPKHDFKALADELKQQPYVGNYSCGAAKTGAVTKRLAPTLSGSTEFPKSTASKTEGNFNNDFFQHLVGLPQSLI